MIPLLQMLKKHVEENPISFHIPGHKYGALWNEEINLLKFDVTELRELDDLHNPTTHIAKAQELAAKLYGVQQTYFLVNGTTVGNLAMMMATLSEGDRVIVQRNCHKSIMNGLLLSGAIPIFIEPMYDEQTGLPLGLIEKDVIEVLEDEPETKAIILTTPNYYGYVTEIRQIIKSAHEKGIPVLVDEAHGAHLTLGSPFPPSAIEMGADIVVHSAHKTLPALTMSSYLHYNSNIVSQQKIEQYLHMLQSSSPSYLLMLSLDIARDYVEKLRSHLNEIVENHQIFIKQLKKIKKIEVVEPTSFAFPHDPLKVIIKSRCEYNGFQLQKALEEVGIYTELADPYHVLFVLPLAKISQMEVIIEKINKVIFPLEYKEQIIEVVKPSSKVTKIMYSYKQLEKMDKICLPLEKAIGYIAAEDIIPYPPGIPVIIKGERIEKSKVEYVLFLKQEGANFQGASDTLMVYRERDKK